LKCAFIITELTHIIGLTVTILFHTLNDRTLIVRGLKKNKTEVDEINYWTFLLIWQIAFVIFYLYSLFLVCRLANVSPTNFDDDD
jgi:hypothetical protein